MKPQELQDICLFRFGREKGIKLAKLIIKIGKLEFCVATAWSDNEVSISRSCETVGQIFKASEDYKTILDPNGIKIDLKKATYWDIEKYLPRARFIEGRTHCQSDIYSQKEK
jgi:hypothetical protein